MSKKTAIARLLSDFIKADNVIEQGEIEELARMSKHYRISEEDKQSAERLHFSEAVAELSQLPAVQRQEIVSGLKSMTLADGKCVPQEAMLMIAVKYCLSGDRHIQRKVSLLSGDSLDVGAQRFKMIYVESDYDEKVNADIKGNLRNIENELNLVGMDFIYIPNVASDFCKMKEDYLKNVITYFVPNLKRERREKIYDSLCTITTERFCKDLLSGKLGIKDMSRVEPSLLVMIGNSSMPYTMEDGSIGHKIYTQYMRISIDGSVLNTVNRFVDDYKEYVENLTTTTIVPNANRIAYYGFHKSLLDLLMYAGKKQDCTILIDAGTGEVRFREIDSTINLTRKFKAMYVTMLQQSLCATDHQMRDNESSLKAFRSIYFELGAESVDEATFADDLTVALSKIRKELTENHAMVKNIERYLPRRGNNNMVQVDVNPEMVWVKISGKEQRLVDTKWNFFGK